MGSRRHSQLVIDYICEYYPNTQTREMAKVLGISVAKIHQIANVRGIKKTKQYIREVHGKRVAILGEKHRYPKGNKPWNKGVKGLKHAPEHTLFKPGHIPANYKPIGWTRVDEEGYTWMKVREGKFAWDMIHRVVWETENGPIPKGKFLRFKDGNKANWELDNLILVDRETNMRMNTIHRYPEEVKQAMKAISKLKKTIQTHGKEQD